MRAAAHTMSTPHLELLPALDLYARIGFDGVEILYTEDYPCALHPSRAGDELAPLRTRLSDLGLGVAQITPYAKDFDVDDADQRAAAVREVERCIELATDLDCQNVRLWAGNEPAQHERQERFERLVDTLRGLAATANQAGVSLNIENHIGSHGVTSSDTVRIIEAVGAGLGITYDPGNLLMLGEGEPLTALERQLPYIRHVHFKDLKVLGNRKHLPALVGEGDVPWSDLMPKLAQSGYDGYFSTEFEKRWHPEKLPDSETGLRNELTQLQALWREATR